MPLGRYFEEDNLELLAKNTVFLSKQPYQRTRLSI